MKPNPFLMTIVVGAGAGLAAALLFAGVVTGTVIAKFLFFLSPLPIAIAWIGFGRTAGLAAAVAGTALVAIIIEPLENTGLFAALIVLPSSWLAQQATMARGLRRGEAAAAIPTPTDLLVRLVLAVIVAIITTGIIFRYDPAKMISEMRDLLSSIAQERPELAEGAGPEVLTAAIGRIIALLPFGLAAMFVIIHAFSLWAAMRLAILSQLTDRRWQPLHTAHTPRWMTAAFLAAIAVAALFPHPASTLALVVAGACGGALILSGLASIHSLTLGRSDRAPLLFATYLLTLLVTVAPILWGLADSFLDLRARKLARQQSNPSKN